MTAARHQSTFTPALLARPPDWMDRAACLDHDPELWHPVSANDPAAKARAICRECPVSIPCLERAMEMRDWEPQTILAGLDGVERHALHKNRQRRERKASA